MPDETTRDELARLRATVAAQEARLARLERPRRRHLPRLIPLVLAALLLPLVPLGLLAANPFTDLTGGPHDANIDAIYNAGVTRGCVPDQEYCPTRNVTREEMASFLARLGGLGSNPPVAHALTAQTADTATNAAHATSADSAASAASADDANTVGGLAPASLVRSAYAVTEQHFNNLTNGATTIVVAATINAPVPGYLLIDARTQFYMHAPTRVSCGVDVDNTSTAINPQPAFLGSVATSEYIELFTFAGGYAPALGWIGCGVAPRLAVAAGAHTVRLKIYPNNAGVADANGGAVRVLFVPFDYNGATP